MATKSSGTQQGVVVWEWENDYAEWIPYHPLSCQDIEQEYVAGTGQLVPLGQRNPTMTNYIIDVVKLQQKNVVTGFTRSIQRNVLSLNSVAARGIVWQWAKGPRTHQTWFSYPTTVIEYIEEKHRKNKLKCKFPLNWNLPYIIDLTNLTQENVTSKYKRPIKRVLLSDPYPLNTIPGNNHIQLPQQNILPSSFSQTQSLSTTYNSSYPAPKSVNQLPYNLQNSAVTNFLHSSFSNSHQSIFPIPNSSNIHWNATSSGLQSTSSGLQTTSGATISGVTKGRQQVKRIAIHPCPQGGIPCSAAGSTKSTVPVTEVLKNFTKRFDVDSSSTEQCAICQSPLTGESGFGSSKETRELNLCKHIFHTECIEASYEHSVKNGCIVCPACNKSHGIKTGTQPPGVMVFTTMLQSLPGFERNGMIEISYNIPPGMQGSEHPHPGQPYNPIGFPRIAFLPDNDQGRQVLLLLIEAWKRRLIFTVGQSSTTGMDDCVIWTGIHHKTEIQSRRGHGYPDATYLDRVTAELEAEGVVPDE